MSHSPDLFQDHHPLVQHVLLCTTGSSTYEINY